jgi:hypothetical protein
LRIHDQRNAAPQSISNRPRNEHDKERVHQQHYVCGDVKEGLRTHLATPGLIIGNNPVVAMARKQQLLHNHLTIIGHWLIV